MILSIKDFDPNNVRIDENSYKNILIYYLFWICNDQKSL